MLVKVMTEHTATIAEWSVGGLTKLEDRPGGGTALGTLDSGTPGGNSKDMLIGFESSLIKKALQGNLLPSPECAVVVKKMSTFLR